MAKGFFNRILDAVGLEEEEYEEEQMMDEEDDASTKRNMRSQKNRKPRAEDLRGSWGCRILPARCICLVYQPNSYEEDRMHHRQSEGEKAGHHES